MGRRHLLVAATLVFANAQSSIYQTAVSAGLTTLAAVLNSSGLAPTFSAPGTYTVFGPTNAAFDAIPPPLLNWLTNTRAANAAALGNTLRYHALGAVVQSGAIPAGGVALRTLCTGTGCTPELSAFNVAGSVTIRASASSPVLATVTTANVNCSNGVVHIINQVLVPSNQGIPTLDVVQTASAQPTLSSLVAALTSANLAAALALGASNNSYTVFAPNNPAFAAAPAFFGSPLADVLSYHVIVGRIYSTDLPLGVNVTRATLAGKTLTVLRTAAGVTIFGATNTATVLTPDVDSTNAVVHIVSSVLVPTALRSIYETAVTAGLTTLAAVLNASGLAPTFSAAGTFTVFGPNNAAFASIPPPLLNWLTYARTANSAALGNTLRYHVLGAVVQSGSIPAGSVALSTLCTACTPVLSAFNSAGSVTIRASASSPVLAAVITPNVTCSNGVVHVINQVLVPSNQGIPTLDVVQTASAEPTLSSLVAALVSANLAAGLELGASSNSYTVFAPNNAAFAAAPAPLGSPLADVLSYHVIVGRIYSTDLPLGVNVTRATLAGQSLSVLRTALGVTIFGAKNSATVLTADVDSTNAVVHIVSSVLLPQTAAPPSGGSLSSGAVAGAVIGSIAGVGGLAAAYVTFAAKAGGPIRSLFMTNPLSSKNVGSGLPE